MKSLITGSNGFIGSYLTDYLLEKKEHVVKVVHSKKEEKDVVEVDVTNSKEVNVLIKTVKPDFVYHLAAQSNIPYSFFHPQETITTNVIGTLNLLNAIKTFDNDIILLSVGSSAEYGAIAAYHEKLSEDVPVMPTSPYAVSKVSQGQLAHIYSEAYGICAMHVRPFAIIGPGKLHDALSDFAKGIVAVERGEKKYLHVGDISHVRDFIDVRDAVSAFELIAKKGEKGESYNICSGTPVRLTDVLDILIALSSVRITVKRDPSKQRPADDPRIVGDPTRINSLGFITHYTLEQTLHDILHYWRTHFSVTI